MLIFWKNVVNSSCAINTLNVTNASRAFPLFSIFAIVTFELNEIIHISSHIPKMSCFKVFQYEISYKRAIWEFSTIIVKIFEKLHFNWKWIFAKPTGLKRFN